MIKFDLIYMTLRFNGHFPGEPGLAGVYWSKGWWRLRFSSDADIVRLTNARIIIIIIMEVVVTTGLLEL